MSPRGFIYGWLFLAGVAARAAGPAVTPSPVPSPSPSVAPRPINVPEWVLNTPEPTEIFLYYVGRGPAAGTRAQGLYAAALDGLAKLVVENFPGSTVARFDGVELLQLHRGRATEAGGDQYEVLLRYPKELAQAEKTRLANLSRTPPSPTPEVKPGTVRLQVDRADALVLVNGRPVAVTGGDPIVGQVPASESVDIELSHPDTVRTIRKIAVAPGATEVRELRLSERPGYVTITSVPAGASADIDETAIQGFQTPVDRLKVQTGKHRVTLRKAGFEPAIVNFTVLRDRLVTLPTITLKSTESKLKRLMNPPWLLTAMVVGNRAGTVNVPSVGAFTYGGSLEYQFTSWVRLRAAYSRGSGNNFKTVGTGFETQSVVTDAVDSNYYELGFSLPIWEVTPVQRFFLVPQYVMARHVFGGENRAGTSEQKGLGLHAEYRQFFEPGDENIVVFGFGARVGLTDYFDTSAGFSGKIAASWTLVELLIGI